jgi:hypothetical protein
MSDLDDWIAKRGEAYVSQLRQKKPRDPAAPKPAKRRHPERDLQRAIVNLAKMFPSIMVASVTNEQRGDGDANQRARYGAARKKSGVVSGYPDIIATGPGVRVEWWELKALNGRISTDQFLVHARLYEQGHAVYVIRDLDHAAERMRHLAGNGAPFRIAAPMQPLERDE